MGNKHKSRLEVRRTRIRTDNETGEQTEDVVVEYLDFNKDADKIQLLTDIERTETEIELGVANQVNEDHLSVIEDKTRQNTNFQREVDALKIEVNTEKAKQTMITASLTVAQVELTSTQGELVGVSDELNSTQIELIAVKTELAELKASIEV